MTEFKAIIGLALGTVVSLMGGFDKLMKAMLVLMLLDIIAGFTASAFFKVSKYSEGGVSSNALFKGAIRKLFMVSMVCIGVVLDKVLDMNYIRNCVCMYFVATEAISILEHCVTMGVPVPNFLVSILEAMKKEADGGEQDVH